jgi:FdhD protein
MRLIWDMTIWETPVLRVNGAAPVWETDALAVEEPLEIRVGTKDGEGPRLYTSLSVTMRTPGHDEELATGFLFTEGIIRSQTDIESIEPWGARGMVRVDLRSGIAVDTRRMERHFYTSSSCGVCGKAGIDRIRVPVRGAVREAVVRRDVLERLPGRLRSWQGIFESTGGLHATALFACDGEPIVVREDVGRHNAMDKAIGFALANAARESAVAVVSGRASFELVQKAAVAGIPVLAAVGAPSSLAVELAEECEVTLIGFLRESRFNVYTHPGRVGGLNSIL